MKNFFFAFFSAFLFASCAVNAQDFAGSWQSSVGTNTDRHRLVLQLRKDPEGELAGVFYLIDDSPDGLRLMSVTQQGDHLAFEVPELKITYKGVLSSDGNTIAGTMNWDGEGALKFTRATPENAWPHDPNCACAVSMIPVEKGVKLEVLDWGGTGRPVVLLAGLGDTAHDFDDFAHKLAMHYHVYGVTRRGFGDSTQRPPTEANFTSNRLGDDVVAVIDALHLAEKPVLVGHSIAGEELSSVGSRYPEKVAGLIYLEGGYEYALYDRSLQSINLELVETRTELEHVILQDAEAPNAMSTLIARLPELEKELVAKQKQMVGLPLEDADLPSEIGPEEAMKLGQQKYTALRVPVLAIFANPPKFIPAPEFNAAQNAAMAKLLRAHSQHFVQAFHRMVPGAEVISIPSAEHYIYRSNQAEVLKDIELFIGKLDRSR